MLSTTKTFERKVSYDTMINEGSILSETYYGKNPELESCEQWFEEMKTGLIRGKNPNKMKQVDQINRTFANLFGFEKFHLIIIADESQGNAFTVPFFDNTNKAIEDHFFDLKKTGHGVKYANPRGKQLYTFVYSFLLRNVSSEQLMAIILHEIGHNFFLVKEQAQNVKLRNNCDQIIQVIKIMKQYNWDSSLYPQAIKYMLDVQKYAEDPQKYFEKEFSKQTKDKAFKEEEANKLSYQIYNIYSGICNIAVSWITVPISLAMACFLPFLAYGRKHTKHKLYKNAKKSQAYNAEKFADNFAVSYGYGVGLASVFNKPTENFSPINSSSKIPLVRIYSYVFEMYGYLGFYFADEHPDNLSRVTFTLTKLKYELANDKTLDSKTKAQIQKEIEDIEDILGERPMFKKCIDRLCRKTSQTKDKIGSAGMDEKEIFDFDKKLLKGRMSEDTSYYDSIFNNESYYDFLEAYVPFGGSEPIPKELVSEMSSLVNMDMY
jgi:hypothetical protein